jgi:CDGSH-type Zn-finger protein
MSTDESNDAAGARPAATITPYRNGPYLLRGDFAILDQDGREIGRARETVALCRCGRSQTKPFCDGTHKAIGFRAASSADAPRPLTPVDELVQVPGAELDQGDAGA